MRLVQMVDWGTSAMMELGVVVCLVVFVLHVARWAGERKRPRSRVAGFALMTWQVHVYVHVPQDQGILKTLESRFQKWLLQAEHNLGPKDWDERFTISLVKPILTVRQPHD